MKLEKNKHATFFYYLLTMISGEVIFPLQVTFKKIHGHILEILLTALLENIKNCQGITSLLSLHFLEYAWIRST